MSTPTCNWTIGDNQTLSFNIHGENKDWLPKAGLYIFTYQDTGGIWRPLYVGQTDDFSARLPSHERLNEAVRLGATHIHARVVPLQADRDRYEEALIAALNPRMNTQLRNPFL